MQCSLRHHLQVQPEVPPKLGTQLQHMQHLENTNCTSTCTCVWHHHQRAVCLAVHVCNAEPRQRMVLLLAHKPPGRAAREHATCVWNALPRYLGMFTRSLPAASTCRLEAPAARAQTRPSNSLHINFAAPTSICGNYSCYEASRCAFFRPAELRSCSSDCFSAGHQLCCRFVMPVLLHICHQPA